MRQADENFIDNIVKAEGPVIIAMGFNYEYMREIMRRVTERVPVKRQLISGLQLDLEDGREILFRSAHGNWTKGRHIDNIIEHDELRDYTSFNTYKRMHEALAPCLI